MPYRAIIAVLVTILLSACAFFSDGASVDYSRFVNIPVTVGLVGGSAPYEADLFDVSAYGTN